MLGGKEVFVALFFGVRDSIHCIGNLEMSGPNGESLCLAHKTTARFFIAGINLRDDGYVIGVVPRRGWRPFQVHKALARTDCRLSSAGRPSHSSPALLNSPDRLRLGVLLMDHPGHCHPARFFQYTPPQQTMRGLLRRLHAVRLGGQLAAQHGAAPVAAQRRGVVASSRLAA